MNLKNTLLEEHSRAKTDEVVDYILANPNDLPKLMDIYFGTEDVLAQRAAMAVGNLGRIHPQWLLPWASQMVTAIQQPSHNAVRRNGLRYFSELDTGQIDEEISGYLLDFSLSLIGDMPEPVANRVYAMQIASNFCQVYPELKNEVVSEIESILSQGTLPSFTNRAKKILDGLRKN